ncbi:uncharacterized protein LOC111339950 isoform X2 [Stylophora pistillata]|uniref:uncharacterized protein LOC111339950 isoform X2 n=1 Tax=Stylophora pistillata TaxID=50429 RepID=UPI000C0555EA|nr:uncharacterized protein LOC111339950 isoform X2 [Stylophora pistillata]
MGTKRKRGQTKQNRSSTNSRKQKKKRKTRRKGFKQAKLTNEVDSLHIEPSTSTDCKLSTPATRERSESSCCAITCASADESVQRSSLWRIGVILNRLKNLASFCQHSTVDWCFSSIRSVYLILNWLKQTFGFGIQTLGKFLLGDKDYPVLLDRKTQLDMMVRRMEALEEEVNQMKSELAKTTCPCGDHCNGSISRV